MFTIGDDKPHPSITTSMFERYLGESESSTQTDEQMLKSAQRLYNVYHIHVGHEEASYSVKKRWKELLGENFIDCPDYTKAPAKIAEIIAMNAIKYDTVWTDVSSDSNPVSSSTISL